MICHSNDDMRIQVVEMIYQILQTSVAHSPIVLPWLPFLIMNHVNEYFENLNDLLSMTSYSDLVDCLSLLFRHQLFITNHDINLRVYYVMSKLIEIMNITSLQAIADSNLIPLTVREIITSNSREGLQYYRKILSSFGRGCTNITVNGEIFRTFTCLEWTSHHHDVILPCLAEMVKTVSNLNLLIPSGLVSKLVQLDKTDELMICIFVLTERTLKDDNTEFLQHLIDNGLIMFFITSLNSGPKNKKKYSKHIVELLQSIMRYDDKYYTLISSLALTPAMKRTILTGF